MFVVNSQHEEICQAWQAACAKLLKSCARVSSVDSQSFSHTPFEFIGAHLQRYIEWDLLSELQYSSLIGRDAHKSILFIAASTVAITPLVAALQAWIGGARHITCRISHRGFDLDFYERFWAALPSYLQDRLSFIAWDHENENNHEQLLAGTDKIIVHGSDQTIEQVQALAKKFNKEFEGHGHQLSFALAPLSQEPQAWRDLFAAELHSGLVAFSQRGCLSPQALYLLLDTDSFTEHHLHNFAQQLAQYIDHYYQPMLNSAQKHHKHLAIEASCLNSQHPLKIYGHSVLLHQPGDLQLPSQSICHGCLHLYRLPQLQQLTTSQILAPKLQHTHLGCLGIARELYTSQVRQALSEQLNTTRMCQLSEMQFPPLLMP